MRDCKLAFRSPWNMAVLLLTLTGCVSNLTAEQVLQAVQLGPDECGTAELSGNLEIGGNPFATTTVVVDIDKQKVSYVDGAGNVQACE